MCAKRVKLSRPGSAAGGLQSRRFSAFLGRSPAASPPAAQERRALRRSSSSSLLTWQNNELGLSSSSRLPAHRHSVSICRAAPSLKRAKACAGTLAVAPIERPVQAATAQLLTRTSAGLMSRSALARSQSGPRLERLPTCLSPQHLSGNVTAVWRLPAASAAPAGLPVCSSLLRPARDSWTFLTRCKHSLPAPAAPGQLRDAYLSQFSQERLSLTPHASCASAAWPAFAQQTSADESPGT